MQIESISDIETADYTMKHSITVIWIPKQIIRTRNIVQAIEVQNNKACRCRRWRDEISLSRALKNSYWKISCKQGKNLQ